jgi:ferredoxin
METTNGNLAHICAQEAPKYYDIEIAETGETFRCSENESVLEGMRRLGKRGIPIGCRSGGCSVCKVKVLSGKFHQHRPMSTEYISKEELEDSCVLACCIKPDANIRVEVIGKMHKNVCKTAG